MMTTQHRPNMIRSIPVISVLLASWIGSGSYAADAVTEPWKPLFDGKTLTGWVQRGGQAKYAVVDGQIVGTTVADTPNSFLCTDKTYGDFILEFEFKVDPQLNSGVQFRSNSFPEYDDGRVHGYQVEIDPSARAWSAGIYDEARRGWLYPLDDNEAARKAFKPDTWNHVRVEAIGDAIKNWLNGVPASHLVDDQTQEGFIALQVHSVGKDKAKEGIAVSFREIRIITDEPAKHARPTPLEARDMYNKLTLTEKAAGWKLLWDGTTTAGWRGAKLDRFPDKGWQIRDGVLTVLESGGGESEAGGDIVTIDNYRNFDLCVDFRLTTGANSGIKYFVDTDLNQGQGSAIGLEYQLLDDEHHPDAKLGRQPGLRILGSLYDLIKPENRYHRPIVQWNHARIVSKDRYVEHWLNGRKVLQYERGSEAFRELVAASKYKTWPGFGELDAGPILLQDHGNKTSFRNVRIKGLK